MHVLQPVVEPDLAAQSSAHPFQELALDAHVVPTMVGRC